MAEEEVIYDEEDFRDHIGTIDEKGNRNWLFPKKTTGKYTNRRRFVSYILLALLFAGPFLRINGEPFFMFNIPARKFIIFGNVFWPQDFYLFVFATVIGVIFITVFTVAFGRLFCGWVCPQTIFMEHVFRRIEYWIDGDRGKQIRLKKMGWTWEKIWKRVLKNSIFYLISFIISNIFLAYIIGSEEWIATITDKPNEHIAGLISILVFSGVFFFVFAWFREQVCIVVCPYGRLQGVLLDKKSVVVAYDYIRGEKRGRYKKTEDRKDLGKGDCIDCHQCVDVCPTGIDIRNGTQLECTNCTACMDACDAIMAKVNLKQGLIRYDSEENIKEGKTFRFNPRIIAYTTVLTVLMVVFSALLLSRTDVEATILRTPGLLFQEQEAEGTLSNLYDYKLINKTNESMPVEFRLLSHEGSIQKIGQNDIVVEKQGSAKGTMFIYIPKAEITKYKTTIKIGVYSDNKKIDEIKTSFNGPL